MSVDCKQIKDIKTLLELIMLAKLPLRLPGGSFQQVRQLDHQIT